MTYKKQTCFRRFAALLTWMALATCLHSENNYDMSSLDQLNPAKLLPLLPEQPRGFGRPISDRAWWEKTAATCNKQNLDGARRKIREMLDNYKPDFSDEAWLDRKQFDRYPKSMVATLDLIERMLVLECLENRGAYLPDIIRLINAYCSIKTWVSPYHDKDAYAFNGKGRFCDLTATRAGKLLATAYYLLGDKLPEASRIAIRNKTREWLFTPYLNSIANGKAVRGMEWINAGNNWNAVCNSQLSCAAAILIDNKEERAKILAYAIRSIVKYLDGFTPDGYCSEGVSYWNYGFGRYVEFAELLHCQTGGNVSLLSGNDKIRNIMMFAANMDMSDERFPAFADCPTDTRCDGYIATVLNARCRIPEYWKYSFNAKNISMPVWSIDRLVQTGQLYDTVTPLRPAADMPGSPGHYFKDGGVVISRPATGDSSAFSLAVKAGHNREFHNHNDIGSFVIDLNKCSVITDPGYPVYTWSSFSPKRYESDAFNSLGHPVPIVNGHLQGNGDIYFKERYWGIIEKCDINPATTIVVMNLINAYPASCGAKMIRRTFIHDRESRKITIIDEAQFPEPAKFASALLSYGDFTTTENGRFVIRENNTAVKAKFSGEPDSLKFNVGKLKATFRRPSAPKRLAIDFAEKNTTFKLTTIINPVN